MTLTAQDIREFKKHFLVKSLEVLESLHKASESDTKRITDEISKAVDTGDQTELRRAFSVEKTSQDRFRNEAHQLLQKFAAEKNIFQEEDNKRAFELTDKNELSYVEGYSALRIMQRAAESL